MAFSVCSINFTAVLLSASLLIITAAIVVSVTSTFSKQAADDYAVQLTRAVVDGGRTRVADYLTTALNMDAGLAFGFRSGSYPNFVGNQSRGAIQEHFQRSLSATTVSSQYRMTAIGAGFEDGYWIYCNVIDGSQQQFFCEVTDPMLKSYQVYPQNGSTIWQNTQTVHDYENGVYNGTRTLYTLYDPRLRPWYAPVKAAGPSGPQRFTGVYSHFFFDYPIVSIDGPIANGSAAGASLLGVSLIAVDLRDLSQYLSELPATAGSATVIVDNDGILLGVSNKAPLFDIFPPAAVPSVAQQQRTYARCGVNGGTGNLVCRRGPAQCNLPTIRQLHSRNPQILYGSAPLLAPSLVAQVDRVQLDGGTSYFVGSSGVASHINLRWRLVTVIPEDDITGEITKGRNLAIILAAVVAVVASVISAAALWFLLRPLRAIAERMYEASTLRDGAGGEAVGSRMAEIRTIEDAFNTLFGQLTKARSFLPASLLAQLDALAASGSDEDDEEDLSAGGDLHNGSLSAGTTTDGGRAERRHTTASAALSSSDRNNSRSHARSQRRSSGSTTASSKSRSHASNVTIFGLHDAAGAGAGAAGAAVAGLRTRHVTVLCLNLRGFHRRMRDHGAAALGAQYALLVESATDAAKARRGVLDSFHGDRFVVTFNAAIPCGGHATAAVHVAAALTDAAASASPNAAAAAKQHGNASSSGSHNTVSTIGIASGVAHIGNTGSTKARRFATVGPVYSHAALLERLAKAVPAPIALVTKAVADDVQHAARTVFVEVVPLPAAGGTASTITTTTSGATDRYTVAPVASILTTQLHGGPAAGGVVSAVADEWMYELDAAYNGPNGGGGPFAAIEGLNGLLRGLVITASAKITGAGSQAPPQQHHPKSRAPELIASPAPADLLAPAEAQRLLLELYQRLVQQQQQEQQQGPPLLHRADVQHALCTCTRIIRSIRTDHSPTGAADPLGKIMQSSLNASGSNNNGAFTAGGAHALQMPPPVQSHHQYANSLRAEIVATPTTAPRELPVKNEAHLRQLLSPVARSDDDENGLSTASAGPAAATGTPEWLPNLGMFYRTCVL